MIRAIDHSDIHKYPANIDAMYQIRAKVFSDRLNWDVHVENGREIDRFDQCSPLYVLSIDEKTDTVEGTLRLLPTTGHNMLRDVFPQLLAEGEMVESATIWESSRFCINPDLPNAVTSARLNRITTDLIYGAIEIGLAVGLSHIVTVYDARMSRIFRSARCPIEVIGGPLKIGTVMTYAGFVEISQEVYRTVGVANHIEGSILEQPVQALPRAA